MKDDNDKAAAAEAKRTAWVSLVKQLAADVTEWSRSVNWEVAVLEKEMNLDDDLGPYVAPILNIRTQQGVIYVDPIARNLARGDGRVDIEDFPSLNRFLLVREKDQWVLYTDAGIRWPMPWSRDTFVDLVRGLQKNYRITG
jgi:hypothetical protein